MVKGKIPCGDLEIGRFGLAVGAIVPNPDLTLKIEFGVNSSTCEKFGIDDVIIFTK